jgi:hypothetical protein
MASDMLLPPPPLPPLLLLLLLLMELLRPQVQHPRPVAGGHQRPARWPPEHSSHATEGKHDREPTQLQCCSSQCLMALVHGIKFPQGYDWPAAGAGVLVSCKL